MEEIESIKPSYRREMLRKMPENIQNILMSVVKDHRTIQNWSGGSEIQQGSVSKGMTGM
jgi:hypothetical protein